MISWAFIFDAPETDSKTDRFVIERGGMRSIMVPVSDPSDAVALAVELVKEGVQMIELCGGFELPLVGKIIEATGGNVPVGHVGFSGARTAAQLVNVFADEL
jgi:hypothetical protein